MEALDRAPRRLRDAAAVAAVAALAVSCSSSGTEPQPFHTFKFVVNSIHVPNSSSDARSLGVDLNGDGTADNALGAFFVVLQQQGLAVQAEVDAAIAAGTMEHLLRVSSRDTTLTQDAGATVDWDVGAGSAPFPGPYTIDNSFVAGGFTGQIAGATFTSLSPATMTVPVGVTLKARLGGTSVILHLNGAARRFTASGGVPTLVAGRIAGSLTASDVQNSLVPALAQAFNGFYHRYPILNEEQPDLKRWRAAVVALVRRRLTTALDLMGCQVPSRM